MYNRNYGGFGLRMNPLGIADVCAKARINAYKPVTDSYTRPLCFIMTNK